MFISQIPIEVFFSINEIQTSKELYILVGL